MYEPNIEALHRTTPEGNPDGGRTHLVGDTLPLLTVYWQQGPTVVDGEPIPRNGVFVEDLIAITIDRIEYYQRTKFCSVENAIALGHLKVAAEALKVRTQLREARGVAGTHEV